MFDFARIRRETLKKEPYYSSNIPDNKVEATLREYARDNGLFFFTYGHLRAQKQGMYALSDDYSPDSSLNYFLLFDPTAPIE